MFLNKSRHIGERLELKIKCDTCGKNFWSNTLIFSNCKRCRKLKRAVIDKVTGSPLSLRFYIFKRDGFKCVVCGRSAREGAILNVDHLHPVHEGGTWDKKNLVTMCFECNQGKKCIVLTEWEKNKLKGIKKEVDICDL